MSKKKNKFDLSHLVHDGHVKEGQTLFFVSDPKLTCKVVRHPSGEYKVEVGKEMTTIHAFALKCLGQDPPDHASKWFRTEKGTTLFDLWHQDDMAEAA
jgi:hypothetical protein